MNRWNHPRRIYTNHVWISKAGSERLRKQLTIVLATAMKSYTHVDTRGRKRLYPRTSKKYHTRKIGVWNALSEAVGQGKDRMEDVFRDCRRRCHLPLLERVLAVANYGLHPGHVNWLEARDVIDYPRAEAYRKWVEEMDRK